MLLAAAAWVPLGAGVAYAAPPAVTALAPASAPRGATVTVTGTGFTGATAVSFNGAAASFGVVSDTEVRATVPDAATSGPVSVTTPEGTGASADAFTVAAGATTLRLWVGPSAVTYGTPVTVAAGLTRTSDGAGLAGEPVWVYARAKGTTTYSLVARLTSGANGSVSVRHLPKAAVEYTLRHPATPAYLAGASGVAAVAVRPRLVARVQPGLVEQYGRVAVDGVVVPPHAGHPVLLQRHVGNGTWQTVSWAKLGADGRFLFRFTAGTTGSFAYRVTKAADADHLAVTSGVLRLSVVRRTLREGMSGPDVLALQHRLAALRMDVGPVHAYYGYDTKHAVVAFQKVHGLPRTGVVDPATRARLDTAALPRLSFPRAGLSVEVDLTRQVVVLGRDGVVQRVFDASSGNDQPYWDQGVRYVAYTPVGAFRIERKINGVRVSRLGELYRPAYFVGGWAIHGSGSVPPYPASHGCVRVTMGAMDRLFPVLPVGTPVRVFRS